MSSSQPFERQVAVDLKLQQGGVQAVLKLLADKCTVPFIARYRKEATGGLDEVQIREIRDRHAFYDGLTRRKQTILNSIAESGQLTDELKRAIENCNERTALEDLYLPYRPKRRTRATAARERGLEPLARRILAQPRDGDPRREALQYVDPQREVPDVDAALAGARDIVAEQIADRAEVRAIAREAFKRHGRLTSAPKTKKTTLERTKFEQYYQFSEPLSRVPSHRVLALFRGEREKVLKVGFDLDRERVQQSVLRNVRGRPNSPWVPQLVQASDDACKRLVFPAVERELRQELKQQADKRAIEIFASNLEKLLLAAPFGGRAVIGIDPGIRTGCKCVALDRTGALKDHDTIYPGRGQRDNQKAERVLMRLAERHKPAAIAVGNGTGGRETEQFVRGCLKRAGQAETQVVLVNESGASIYSASDIAREEFPDLDVSVRGAVSIGRRLQDPLAELVKIDPKSIGVGQYQHDVEQTSLQQKLGDVVVDCVNRVGVQLNTASPSLLAHVSGIGPKLARAIVDYRNRRGRFETREMLHEVPGLGKRTFEQAAGFLRIADGAHPLDASAVHPERYKLVRRIATDLGVDLARLIGSEQQLARVDRKRYLGDDVGEPTLNDIFGELLKPGRDPREGFEAPRFREDVSSIEDLKRGMQLEGVVTNVTAFGAFVDIGVKQDGLVHISQLADHFVRDPAQVVSVGDRLNVRVLEIDLERRRISLTAKSGDAGADSKRRH